MRVDGWYWYRPTARDGWQIVRVLSGEVFFLGTHRRRGLAALIGQWGPRVEPPENAAETVAFVWASCPKPPGRLTRRSGTEAHDRRRAATVTEWVDAAGVRYRSLKRGGTTRWERWQPYTPPPG
jgi:hypothetical protein